MIGEKVSKTIDFFVGDSKYRQSPQFPVKQKVTDGVMFYHCKRHDYMYYPEPVTNEEGVRYRAGYYDETGKYYSELKLYHSFPEEGLVCKYCGHCVTEDEFTEMEALKCPNCDASFELLTPSDAVKKDKVVMSEVNFSGKSEADARRYIPDVTVAKEKQGMKRAAYDPKYNSDLDKEYEIENYLGKESYDRWMKDLSLYGTDAQEEVQEEEEPTRKANNIIVLMVSLLVLVYYLFLCIFAIIMGWI